MPSIFDKLTNPALYTGSHKERFDAEGRGKGKAGRTTDEGPRDLSQMTRPELHPAEAKPTADRPTGARAPKKVTGKMPSIFEKLCDTKQYTGAHKKRFDEEGRGRGKEGRVDENEGTFTIDFSEQVRPELHPGTGKKTTTTATKKPSKPEDGEERLPSIFEKLTDSKLYTGAHKHRFDEEGHGMGKEGRTGTEGPIDFKDMTRPNLGPKLAA